MLCRLFRVVGVLVPLLGFSAQSAVAAMQLADVPDSVVSTQVGAEADLVHAAPLTAESFRVFSWRLGKGFVPAQGVRLTPYFEMDTLRDGGLPMTLGPFMPNGRMFVGGAARYALASNWTLSFDLAAGVLFRHTEAAHMQNGAGEDGDDEGHIWRSELRLDYAVDRKMVLFSSVGLSQLGQDQMIGTPVLPHSDSADGSIRLGLSFRF